MRPRSSLSLSLLAAFALVPCSVHAQPTVLQPTSGPSGGPVGQLVMATDGDLFAIADGLHRSADSGWSWHLIPADPGTNRLAAGLAGDVWAWGSGGLFRTSDDGATWTPLASAPTEIHQLTFATQPHVFAATAHGVYASADAGATWTQATEVPVTDVPAIVSSSGATSAAAGNAIYRTEDLGTTWIRVAELDGDITALAVHPQDGYYAGVVPGFGGPPVGGIHHVRLDGTVLGVGLEHHWIDHLFVRSDGVVFTGSAGWCDGYNWFGQGIYRSDDGRDPWVDVGCGGYVGALVAGAGDLVFAAMLDGFTDIGGLPACGVMVTSGPGTQWFKRNRGLGKATIFDIAASEAGIVYAVADWTIAWSEDDGASWNEVETPLPAVWPEDGTWHLAAHPDGTLFAVHPYLPLHRSTDRGRTWTTPMANGPTRVSVTANGTAWVGTWQGELWRSTDSGATWTLAATEADHSPIRAMASGPLGRLAIATPSVIVLVEGDGEWSAVLPTTGQPAFAPDEHAVYVATGIELQRWVEEAGGWVQQPMPAIYAEDVAVDPEGRVYAATRVSVAWTTPGEATWHDLATVEYGWYLGQKPRLVFGSDDYLYFGTSSDGVYRSSTPVRSPTSVEDRGRSILATWGCAPNPARGASRVTFALDRSSHVDVSVYDVRGRLVAMLASERAYTPGSHALEWNPAEGTPSGVYTYRIRAGDVVRSGRIVLIR